MNNELNLNHIYHEDCLETLKRFPDNYFHSIVTDPPYGLSKHIDPMEVMKAWVNNEDYKAKGKGFMGNEWDNFVPQPKIWKECLRVLRPGGYLLAFSSTRTYDWMAMALRFGGFEVVDTIMWVYGNGMPKFHNIGKNIDKKFGNEREVTGKYDSRGKIDASKRGKNKERKESNSIFATKTGEVDITKPASKEAEKWEGFNPTVKPAVEPIVMARKPIEGTYVDNVLKWGCGALNTRDCRVDRSDGSKTWDKPKGGCWKPSEDNDAKQVTNTSSWCANLMHDGSEEVERLFPNTKSGARSSTHKVGNENGMMQNHGIYGKMKAVNFKDADADEGSASRFFAKFPFEEADRIIYTGKAKPSEKQKGLEKFEKKEVGTYAQDEWSRKNMNSNTHPTVKPLKLMRYLVRLVTPPEGICYEPFGGSGTTGVACILEGLKFVMSEREAEYVPIAKARVAEAEKEMANKPLELF